MVLFTSVDNVNSIVSKAKYPRSKWSCPLGSYYNNINSSKGAIVFSLVRAG